MKLLSLKRFVTVSAVTALFLLCVAVLLINPTEREVPCAFRLATGLHCPSCGGTRWAYCMLTFNFKDAFYYHAYFTVISPLIIYALVAISVNNIVGKRVIPYPKRAFWIYIACLLGLIAFTVIRNFTAIVY